MAASSLEQKLSRLEAKLKQENREARRRIDLNLEISPQRPRPTLQLPLANDGGSRSPSSESSPQHPTPPSRPRHMLGLPSTLYAPRSMESIEIDQKLQEIMKQTGYLTIGGQRYQAEISDLENLGEMGSGTCGQVWKMRFRKTGHVIAVKQMRRSGNKEENKRILMDLDVVLKSHDCPYIVQCFGTFITNTDVFIAMELMGTCAEKLKKRVQGPIPERILGKMTVAIVKALFYLKEKHGVIHRDVKPSNILLDERGQIKLCDFGISGRLVDSKAKTRSAGCAAYMAPERIDPPDPTKPDYDIRADVWSLGISLVELATGQFPYKNCKTDFEVLTKVLQEEPPLLPGHMDFSGDFQSFVKDCLTKDHRKRPKYNKLLEHSFIKRYEMLDVDVASWFKDVMAKTESPRTSGIQSQHHLPFFSPAHPGSGSTAAPTPQRSGAGMKPPQRRRAAPARYLHEASARPAVWSGSERRQLLRLLQVRRGQPELDAAELARELPGRSETEVKKFLQQLKGRVTREAIQRGAQGPRCRETQTPAPIEVWIDLAEKITGPLEESLMAAFSQVFTIAATEPVSLLHSIPTKPTQVRGRPLTLSIPRKRAHPTTEPSCPATEAPSPASDPLGSTLKTHGPTPEVPSLTHKVSGPTPSPVPVPKPPDSTPRVPSPTPSAPLEEPEDMTVDFEKIYKYLSSLTRSGHGPELSAAESAVLLDLLMALPEELQKLPCEALVQHMLDMYQHLTDPQPDPADVDVVVTDARTDARTDSGPQEESSLTPSQAEEPRDSGPQKEASSTLSQAEEPRDSGPQEETSSTPSQAEEPRDSSSRWKVPGVCPLNPFLVPLELLGRVTNPAR